jgi:hydroxymethylpyrimidine pyrophosphatase-like HAD family hydrolase
MPYWFRAVAVDYDGTIAEHGEASEAALHALAELRRRGRRVILCTGRILAELSDVFPDFEAHFDAVVAENGAVLLLPGSDARALAAPLPAALREALRDSGVPARAGTVILATQASFDAQVLHEIGRIQVDAQLVRNRSELMVLPSGVSKATGLREALAELGVSSHNTIAFGDAENDHAIMQACEVGVAVGNAVAGLRERADVVLPDDDGRAVAAFLLGPVLSGEVRTRTARWTVALGSDERGAVVSVPAARTNILVSGASCSGKSYIAGAFIERLSALGYTACVFDAEGDHGTVQQARGVVTVGGPDPLPAPAHIARLISNRFTSVVVDMSSLDHEARRAFFDETMRELIVLRRSHGLPHWIVIEEADQLLQSGALPAEEPYLPPLGYLLVTHRPDTLSREVLQHMHAVVALTGAEPYARMADDLATPALSLPVGQAMLALDGRVTRFQPSRRISPHVRHRTKYMHVAMPEARRFHFGGGGGEHGSAANLDEFTRRIATVDGDVLIGHLKAGDFSRWVNEIVADDELSSRLRSIERWFRNEPGTGRTQAREAVISAVEARYAHQDRRPTRVPTASLPG